MDKSINFLVTVKTIADKENTIWSVCELTGPRLPMSTDRDELIDFINNNTVLFCDDVTNAFYNGNELWHIPDGLQYNVKWEDRIKGDSNCTIEK